MGFHWCASDKGGGRGSADGKGTKRVGGAGVCVWWWGSSGRSAKLWEEALASWTEGGGWAGVRKDSQTHKEADGGGRAQGMGHGAPGAAGAGRGLTAELWVHTGSHLDPATDEGVVGLESGQVPDSQSDRCGLGSV